MTPNAYFIIINLTNRWFKVLLSFYSLKELLYFQAEEIISALRSNCIQNNESKVFACSRSFITVSWTSCNALSKIQVRVFWYYKLNFKKLYFCIASIICIVVCKWCVQMYVMFCFSVEDDVIAAHFRFIRQYFILINIYLCVKLCFKHYSTFETHSFFIFSCLYKLSHVFCAKSAQTGNVPKIHHPSILFIRLVSKASCMEKTCLFSKCI